MHWLPCTLLFEQILSHLNGTKLKLIRFWIRWNESYASELPLFDLKWPLKPWSRLNALNLIQFDHFVFCPRTYFVRFENIMSDYDFVIHWIPYTFEMTCSIRGQRWRQTVLRTNTHTRVFSSLVRGPLERIYILIIIKLIDWIIN